MCTRLLLAVIPSVFYVKDETLDGVLQAIVTDLLLLQQEGLSATLIN